MTYQNLGYWVGQSNDTSTGSHPTGWTNGQRWSETASEWQTMYSASASDATLWHGRADQAWGTSRIWSSGESWEAAYARVLPPAAPSVTTQALSTGAQAGQGLRLTGTRAVPLTGYYVIVADLTGTAGARADAWASLTIQVAGSTVVSRQFGGSSSQATPVVLSYQTPAPIAAGTVIGALVADFGLQAANPWSGTLYLYFIPTQANPH